MGQRIKVKAQLAARPARPKRLGWLTRHDVMHKKERQKIKMQLYTFILDFAGGTYISQVNAPSPTSASVKWAKELDISGLKGIGIKNKESLIKQIKEEQPQPLEGILNTWCMTACLRGGLALINIVQTDSEERHQT